MTGLFMERVDLEGLVHDLNNVFQAISDSAEILHHDPKWARLAGVINRNVETGKRLATSILEGNRVAADCVAVINRAVQFASDYLEGVHGPAIEFTLDIHPDCILPGDPAAWERVLVNLFLNAAQAKAGAVSVTAKPGVITVEDDGPGIAVDLLPHIFEPHVSTKAIFSGLGLYVVKSIVEQYGGTVEAANHAPHGARFRITIVPPPNVEGQPGQARAGLI